MLPSGKELDPSPLILVHVSPPLVLRYRPPRPPFWTVETSKTGLIAPPGTLVSLVSLYCVATTEVILSPFSSLSVPPLTVQVSPPSVVLRIPIALPPCLELLTTPVPAYRVLWLASVGSKTIEVTDSEGMESVSGVQCGNATVVVVTGWSWSLTVGVGRGRVVRHGIDRCAPRR